MKKRTYKREDMIDLNEANVAKIYSECLAENNPPEKGTINAKISTDPSSPTVEFSPKKIVENTEKINYMYGQLYYRWGYEIKPGLLPISAGCIKYDETIWTKDQDYLFAFYYLGNAALVIDRFLDINEAHFVNYKKAIPTLSPNDPNFEAWCKTVIEE